MSSSVKTDYPHQDWVTVQGAVLNARTSDLILDSPARRGNAGGPYRRALVHDQSDGLTINFNDDYPGGVTINDARLIVTILPGGGEELGPALPKHGTAGEIVATRSELAGTVTLWLCLGHPFLVVDDSIPVTWVPISTGDAVQGSV